MKEKNTNCILDSIIGEVSPPQASDGTDKFSMLVSQIEFNEFHGRITRGKVASGGLKLGDDISCYNSDGKLITEGVVKKIYKDVSLNYVRRIVNL